MNDSERVTAIDLREECPDVWAAQISEGWGKGFRSVERSPEQALASLKQMVDSGRKAELRMSDILKDETEEATNPAECPCQPSCERKAVVTYLRKLRSHRVETWEPALDSAADAIERGDHRPGNPEAR